MKMGSLKKHWLSTQPNPDEEILCKSQGQCCGLSKGMKLAKMSKCKKQDDENTMIHYGKKMNEMAIKPIDLQYLFVFWLKGSINVSILFVAFKQHLLW